MTVNDIRELARLSSLCQSGSVVLYGLRYFFFHSLTHSVQGVQTQVTTADPQLWLPAYSPIPVSDEEPRVLRARFPLRRTRMTKVVITRIVFISTPSDGQPSLCSAFVLTEAVPLAPGPKPVQSRKTAIDFASHESLRLTGARAPPPKVLMPPLDLGFKGQTGSESRKPSRSAGGSGGGSGGGGGHGSGGGRKSGDYQSDAASDDPWSVPSASATGIEDSQNFRHSGPHYSSRPDGKKVNYGQGKRKSKGFNTASDQGIRDTNSYQNEPSNYQTAWNPYIYPPKIPNSPSSSSSSYFSEFRNGPSDHGYPGKQNSAYNSMPNHGPYAENSRSAGSYQHPYRSWESAGFINPGPVQSNPNQPVLAPYPFVQYDVGARGVGDPYGRWEPQTAYYQPPAQSFWNPYAPPQAGWYTAQLGPQPILQGGQTIQFIPPNAQRPAEMRPTSVIGHPSNYREISREEMSQRVREYEQAQQSNGIEDLRLPSLSNADQTGQSKDPTDPGNSAHDQAVRHFVGIASEWSVIGVDALFDEIDLNGKNGTDDIMS
ncbi:unnamed protein product [Echinostoma caproni]|uniref:BAT2_N domain-containing protein n=1 Tax=Echinostoma caproni TaxID=27848 RepID=A0A183AAT3_9TREM|nr:unnamed protein product [Echinostoma caproni]